MSAFRRQDVAEDGSWIKPDRVAEQPDLPSDRVAFIKEEEFDTLTYTPLEVPNDEAPSKVKNEGSTEDEPAPASESTLIAGLRGHAWDRWTGPEPFEATRLDTPATAATRLMPIRTKIMLPVPVATTSHVQAPQASGAPSSIPVVQPGNAADLMQYEADPAVSTTTRVLSRQDGDLEEAPTVCFEDALRSQPHSHRLLCGHTVDTETPTACGQNCATSSTADHKAKGANIRCKACLLKAVFIPKKRPIRATHARATRSGNASIVLGASAVNVNNSNVLMMSGSQNTELTNLEIKGTISLNENRPWQPTLEWTYEPIPKRSADVFGIEGDEGGDDATGTATSIRKRRKSALPSEHLDATSQSTQTPKPFASGEHASKSAINDDDAIRRLNKEIEQDPTGALQALIKSSRGPGVMATSTLHSGFALRQERQTSIQAAGMTKEVARLKVASSDGRRYGLRGKAKLTDDPTFGVPDTVYGAKNERQRPHGYARRVKPGKKSTRDEHADMFSMVENRCEQMLADGGATIEDKDTIGDQLPRNQVDGGDQEIDEETGIALPEGLRADGSYHKDQLFCICKSPADGHLQRCSGCRGMFHPACVGKGDMWPAAEMSTGYECDGCDKDIVGTRYNCRQCEIVDFCSKCFSNKNMTHNRRHGFDVIEPPKFTCRDCDEKAQVALQISRAESLPSLTDMREATTKKDAQRKKQEKVYQTKERAQKRVPHSAGVQDKNSRVSKTPARSKSMSRRNARQQTEMSRIPDVEESDASMASLFGRSSKMGVPETIEELDEWPELTSGEMEQALADLAEAESKPAKYRRSKRLMGENVDSD